MPIAANKGETGHTHKLFSRWLTTLSIVLEVVDDSHQLIWRVINDLKKIILSLKSSNEFKYIIQNNYENWKKKINYIKFQTFSSFLKKKKKKIII